MDQSALLNGLLLYLCFIPVLTFHEFAHAWMASKCGDDTAKNLGRVSLNPAVHIDTIMDDLKSRKPDLYREIKAATVGLAD